MGFALDLSLTTLPVRRWQSRQVRYTSRSSATARKTAAPLRAMSSEG